MLLDILVATGVIALVAAAVHQSRFDFGILAGLVAGGWLIGSITARVGVQLLHVAMDTEQHLRILRNSRRPTL